MKYRAYIADIEDNVDASTVDFESTEYYETDNTLVSPKRIRIEWMQNDEFWGITLHQNRSTDGIHVPGQLECRYLSWEGGRYVEKLEKIPIQACIISEDIETDVHEQRTFWIDIPWKIFSQTGRFLFELEGQ